MTDCQGDVEAARSPMELYEELTAQGDQVRALKTAKADKVSVCKGFGLDLCVIMYVLFMEKGRHKTPASF